MPKPSSPTELAEVARISVPYASQILSDDPARQRTPSRALAIHIMRTTGWRHASIAKLTDEQITTLETVEPYRPSTEHVAAA